MKSKWIAPVLVLIITACLSLFAAEVTVRVIEPKKILREHFEQPDPVFHHRFIPGATGTWKKPEFHVTYAINSLGLRDREISKKKPIGTKRILMLGDSFTEGNGVEAKDAFPARVQALIDGGAFSTRWQVVNAGEGSYSPLLHYLLLKKQLLSLEPDLVILNLDLSDVHDDIQYTKIASFDASGDPIAVRPEPKRKPGAWYVEAAYSFKDFVKEHTRLYNFLRRHIASYFAKRPGVSSKVSDDKYAMIRDGYDIGDGGEWKLTFGYIERIHQLLAARGIPLWLSVYPYGHQVSPKEWHTGRLFWSFEQNRVYTTGPQKYVEAFGRTKNIPVINMVRAFQERSKRQFPLYFPSDGHFQPAGHAVAAEAIFQALEPFLRDAEVSR